MHIYDSFLVVTVSPMHLSSIYLKFMENPNPGPMATPSVYIYIYTRTRCTHNIV